MTKNTTDKYRHLKSKVKAIWVLSVIKSRKLFHKVMTKGNPARIPAKAEAELEKQKMADDVKKEMISIASVMAGKVVAASIDTNIQNSLIDETLKEIGDSTWLS